MYFLMIQLDQSNWKHQDGLKEVKRWRARIGDKKGIKQLD